MNDYAIEVILRGVVLASGDDEESAAQLAIDHARQVLDERSPFVEYDISPLRGLAKDVATAVKVRKLIAMGEGTERPHQNGLIDEPLSWD